MELRLRCERRVSCFLAEGWIVAIAERVGDKLEAGESIRTRPNLSLWHAI